MIKTIVLMFLFFSMTVHALALPVNRLNTHMVMPKTFTTNYDFEGIVALSNCSGGLIQLEGVSDANPALIMTNGHCIEGGFTPPGEFVSKRPSVRTFILLTPDGKSAGKVTANQVVYSTMTKTDLTIYKLNETYADIKAKFGIRPLTLSSSVPSMSEAIDIISGYWIRGYSCSIENFVNELHEEGYVWKNSLRFSRPGCETIGGTSGSPITKAGTKIVIGINNTGNEDGESCSMNNPCEVDQNGKISFTKGYSYGQQTYWLYSCLTTSNEVDIAVPGCQLPH